MPYRLFSHSWIISAIPFSIFILIYDTLFITFTSNTYLRGEASNIRELYVLIPITPQESILKRICRGVVCSNCKNKMSMYVWRRESETWDHMCAFMPYPEYGQGWGNLVWVTSNEYTRFYRKTTNNLNEVLRNRSPIFFFKYWRRIFQSSILTTCKVLIFSKWSWERRWIKDISILYIRKCLTEENKIV